MLDPRFAVALAAPAANEPSPFSSLVLMGIIFAIFYFILILPMKKKQKKVEDLQRALKAGDKIVLNAGIFGTVVGVEGDALSVRIADQTKIKVLRSAIAGLQGPSTETEKK
ncbi:MAG: preprotein translocase subunit YajC [Acidobacteria bacterium]|nr:preprotein translocase subunit YajC [Acidobacteriota bacterium]